MFKEKRFIYKESSFDDSGEMNLNISGLDKKAETEKQGRKKVEKVDSKRERAEAQDNYSEAQDKAAKAYNNAWEEATEPEAADRLFDLMEEIGREDNGGIYKMEVAMVNGAKQPIFSPPDFNKEVRKWDTEKLTRAAKAMEAIATRFSEESQEIKRNFDRAKRMEADLNARREDDKAAGEVLAKLDTPY